MIPWGWFLRVGGVVSRGVSGPAICDVVEWADLQLRSVCPMRMVHPYIVLVRNDGVGSVDVKQDQNMLVRCRVLTVWVVVGPSFS